MLTRLQEIALIARCIAGDDRNAFGELVEAYADDIRRLLMSLTGGNAALVNDLSQEVFIKAFLSIRSFNGIARFRTWIYRIAYNEYISYKRREKVHQSIDDLVTVSGEELHDIEYESASFSESSDKIIHQALMNLPENERVVTQLFYFDDFSIAKISSITGFPTGTVKSYLHRARQKLSSLLKNYYS